jgi:hypothetical protein
MREPTEEQYLVINALDMLGLLIENRYDQDTGVWYIFTPSQVLPLAIIRRNGEVTPIEPISEL